MFPEEIRFKTNTLLKIAVSPIGAFLIGGAVVLLFRQWPADNAAAWVQAVGSIGAIIGAFLVATRTHKLEQRAIRYAELGVESKAVRFAERVVQDAANALLNTASRNHQADDAPSSLRRMESVHQTLLLVMNQPANEQVLEPVLVTLKCISSACGILQDAKGHGGVLRQKDIQTLETHHDQVKKSLGTLRGVLKDIGSRREQHQ